MAFGKKTDTVTVLIPQIKRRTIDVWLIGDEPLITNAWSAKALRSMIAKHTHAPTAKKAPRDIERDFVSAIYFDDDGHFAVPTTAIKSAVIDSFRYVENIKSTIIRGAVFVKGQHARIWGPKPIMRMDPVRNSGMGNTADVRFRPMYTPWAINVQIEFMENAITAEQVVTLLNYAGFGVGIGEWRPEKQGGGNFGKWHVGSPGEEKEIVGLTPKEPAHELLSWTEEELDALVSEREKLLAELREKAA